MRPSRPLKQALWWILVSVCLGAVVLALVRLPAYQLAEISETSTDAQLRVAELRNTVRQTTAQIIGGVAILIGLWLTARRIRASERNVEIAQEGQLTDRFASAVEHLGGKSQSLRLGGIYALERIAADSEKDYWPIMEILTAFLRSVPSGPKNEATPNPAHPPSHDEITPQDRQAVINVLRRRQHERERRHLAINLARAKLAELDISGLYLAGASMESCDLLATNLQNSNLEGADLRFANLSGANLGRARLVRARLRSANLVNALLDGADLSGADLAEASLRSARLPGANLRRARLAEADFENATLVEADLRGTDLRAAKGLSSAQISAARTDERTQLPGHLIPHPLVHPKAAPE